MKNLFYKVCILVLVIIFVFATASCSQKQKLINDKQWYMKNVGNPKYISECAEYNKYIPMHENVDIDYLEMIKLFDNKDIGEEVIVALFDTGVDFSHDGLKNSMWVPDNQKSNKNFNGNFFIDASSNMVVASFQKSEFDPHGTGCAGIISAKINDGDIAGIASTRNVKIMSVNITNDSKEFTSGRTEDLVKAIKFAELNNAKVCNISFSTEDYSKELYEIIKNSNMLFVVSAGNGRPLGYSIDKHPLYPASIDLPNVITVANLNYNGKINRSSNFGKNFVDITAPGTCIYTMSENNAYQFQSGTSIAAPMVTAVACVILSIDNTVSATEVKNIIMENSDYYALLNGKVKSSGALNAYKAVKSAMELASTRG